MKTVYRNSFALLTLIFTIFLSGCAAKSDYSAQDIMFAEMMIPHHEQAIEMSDLALAKSSNPEILKLAQQIKDAQDPEIQQMKSWTGVNVDSHMGHMMDGMLSDEEIENLKNAVGAEFDRLFLEGMIAHHEGAIEMAENVEDSKNTEVSQLGQAIIKTQRNEIAFMKKLLISLKP